MKSDFEIGDEIISLDADSTKAFLIVFYRPDENWIICINREDGWHYSFPKTRVHKTGRSFIFSDKLKREIDDALAYRFNIPRKLLTDEHIKLKEN